MVLSEGQKIKIFKYNEPNGHYAKIINLIRFNKNTKTAVYKAIYHRKKGVLLELYDEDFQKRADSGRLSLVDKLFSEDFMDFRNKIVNLYRAVQKAAVPCFGEFDILFGSSVNDKNYNKKDCSVYIWMPGEFNTSFTSYLDCGNSNKQVHSPEHKLHGIIRTLIVIAESVNKLNEQGLRFTAINPEDIFVTSNKKSRITGSAKLLSVDSICADDRDFVFDSDCDSLGRLAFRMITGSEYKNEFSVLINEKIRNSHLILSSSLNSDIYIINMLSDLISKLVSGEFSGYVEILSCFHSVEKQLLFEKTGTARVLDSSKTIRESKNVSTAVIQNMLDIRPLYTCLPENSRNLHVLTIGSGNYGQEFINQALQAGQMKDINLKITALSDNPSLDKVNYLTNKPELNRFISIDNEAINDSYAELDFKPINSDESSFSLVDLEQNQNLIINLVDRFEDAVYVFVALGNDKLNKDIAEMYAKTARDLGIDCCVNFVSRTGKTKSDIAYPVYVNSKASNVISKSLFDMAFKVHLSWGRNTSKDISTIESEFKNDIYSYNSSIANALSIRYKLYGLGIEYDSADNVSLVQAADKFNKLVIENEDRSNFNKLIWLEHRRWNLEKLISGWTVLKTNDYKNSCERLSIKDNIKLRHHCIVKSSEEVNSDIWKENIKLDALDRVSVELNKVFGIIAEENRKNWPEQEDTLALIGNRIEKANYSPAVYSYKRFIIAVKNIVSDSNKEYAKKYACYRSQMLDACEKAKGKTFSEEISSLLNSVDKALFPFIEYSKKTDYKMIDSALVSKIPYILTCPVAPTLAMGFSAKHGNDEMLKNIAPVITLSANQAYYFYYYDSNSNINHLARRIKTVVKFLEKKNFFCEIDLYVAVDKNCSKIINSIKDRITDINGIHNEIVECADEYHAHKKFKEYLSDKKIDFFNRSSKTYRDDDLNDDLYQTLGYPGFFFSPEKRRFKGDATCDFIKYTDASDFVITTDDLLLLADAKDSSFNFSGLSNSTKILWKYVCNTQKDENFAYDIRNWNFFCKTFSNHCIKNEALLYVENINKLADSQETKNLSYNLPSLCFKSAKKIIDSLLENNLIKSGLVRNRTDGICVIEIALSKLSLTEKFDSLFGTSTDILSNSSLIKAELIRTRDEKNEEIKKIDFAVLFDSLKINDLDIKKQNNESGGIDRSYVSILRRLENNKLIKRCKIDEEKFMASFEFVSYEIKNVLKKEGELLEQYIFNEAVKSGYFDDVAGGFEFVYELNHSKEQVKNEVDCLLTKGCQTLVVEAKARIDIDQNVIHKLCNVADNIGVNAKKILVITNHGKLGNDLQFARGDRDEVIIIEGKENINNIGRILQEIAEGTYISKEYI